MGATLCTETGAVLVITSTSGAIHRRHRCFLWRGLLKIMLFGSILYLLFKEDPSYEVIEAYPDVHLELDKKGRIVGIEIWNIKRSGLIEQVEIAIAETA